MPGAPDSEEHFEGSLTRKHEWESTTKRAGNRYVHHGSFFRGRGLSKSVRMPLFPFAEHVIQMIMAV